MTFQVVIGAQSLKTFVKCLACLARYGDDVIIQAGLNSLLLSSTNSSKSAFCQVKFGASYFEKYYARASQPPELTFRTPSNSQPDKIVGQLVVKSLLSILRHKTIDKIIERCQLSISDPGHGDSNDAGSDEEKDSLELRLIVRLYCKHGIIKTHKLVLLTPTNIPSPRLPTLSSESHVIIGPRALKDILEHFPHTKGSRSDLQLLWLFGMNDVKVKTYQAGSDTKGGKSQLSTEISINADEFESYQVHEPPSSIAFYLKEFNATVALAEALSMALDIRFTKPTEPLYIEFESDASDYEFLFIISTTNNSYNGIGVRQQNNLKKRQRVVEETMGANIDNQAEGSSRAAKKRSEHVAGSSSLATTPRQESSVLRSSTVYRDQSPNPPADVAAPETRIPVNNQVPLFMPGASQLSNPDTVTSHPISRVEHLAYEDFEAMMDASAEVGMSTKVGIQRPRSGLDASEDDDMEDGDGMFPATQHVDSGHNKTFRPLFDD